MYQITVVSTVTITVSTTTVPAITPPATGQQELHCCSDVAVVVEGDLNYSVQENNSPLFGCIFRGANIYWNDKRQTVTHRMKTIQEHLLAIISEPVTVGEK